MRAEVPRRRVQDVRDHEPRAGRARLVPLHRHRHGAGGPRARSPYRIQPVGPAPPPRARHRAPPQGEACYSSQLTYTSVQCTNFSHNRSLYTLTGLLLSTVTYTSHAKRRAQFLVTIGLSHWFSNRSPQIHNAQILTVFSNSVWSQVLG